MSDQPAPGRYETAPLAKERWTLGVVQSRIHAAADAAEQAANLRHMLHLIDNACHYGGGPDLLLFHEFPISGWDTWTRAEAEARCIEIPGRRSPRSPPRPRSTAPGSPSARMCATRTGPGTS